ncbi:MAG: hypothetical protein LBK42_06455 [Propionibacteriaceae bacterium]|jgi:hypothetical protein|nr:hypothetical protein [Propionibacteriaceae bacterium]
MTGQHNEVGGPRPLTAAAACRLELDWGALAPAEVRAALWAAEAAWGLAGVVLAGDAPLVGLLTPGDCLPGGHPLALAGVESERAGLLALTAADGRLDRARGRVLILGLAARLPRRCRSLEAQGAARRLAAATAPPAVWLTAWGFTAVPGAGRRFRLDLRRTIPSPRPAWLPGRVETGWGMVPAPATRNG